jgi:hypothetical protein
LGSQAITRHLDRVVGLEHLNIPLVAIGALAAIGEVDSAAIDYFFFFFYLFLFDWLVS